MTPPPATLDDRLRRRATRWQRYLGDLQEHAAQAWPLQTEGTLLRVTGLVLEAAGVRVPVGSLCRVVCDNASGVTDYGADATGSSNSSVLAEVVGFSGDRAYLMPMGELHGLSSGARVLPLPAPLAPPRWGEALQHPWRRSEDRGLHLPMGDGLLGRVVD